MDSDPLGRTQQEIQSDNLYEQHALSRKKASLKFSFSVLDGQNSRRSYGSGLSIKDAIAQAVSNAETKTVAFEAITIATPPAGIRDSFVFSIDPNNPDATRPDVKRITKEDLEVSDSRFRDIRNVYRKPVLHHLQYDDSVAHIGEVMESINATRNGFYQVDKDRAYVKGKNPFSLLDPITPRNERTIEELPKYVPPAILSGNKPEIAASSPTAAATSSTAATTPTAAAAAANKSTPRKTSKPPAKKESGGSSSGAAKSSGPSKSSIPTLPPLHGGHAFASAENNKNAGHGNRSNSKNSARIASNPNSSRSIAPTFVDNKPKVVLVPTKKDGVIADDGDMFTDGEPQTTQDSIITYEGEDDTTMEELTRSTSNEAAYDVLINHRHARFHTEDMDRPIIPASKSLFLYLDKVRRQSHNDHT